MAATRMSKEDIQEAGRIIMSGMSDTISNRIGALAKEIGQCSSYTDCIGLLARASVMLQAGSCGEKFKQVVEASSLKEEEFLSEILHRESHDNHVQS